uniref:(northern house mosquito) hypothetical protein n=1 Tax=Culex pipiens TaxID=7175 RepID=A0A8D8BHN0_CULPI
MGVSLNCRLESCCCWGVSGGDCRCSWLAAEGLVGLLRSSRISPSERVFWSFFFLRVLGDGMGETRGLKSMKISFSSCFSSSFSLSDSQVEQDSSEEDLVSSCMSSGWMFGGVMGQEGGGWEGVEKIGG